MVRPAQRQRGAAILVALLILTLVATLAAGMVWLQWRGIEVEAAERARTQADWLLKASLDWGNVILKSQMIGANAPKETDLGQPWATPLAETRLSSFLSADGNHSDDGGPEAYLSGQITDATSKYNLYNLLVPPPAKEGDPGPGRFDELNRLRLLCGAIGVPPDTANAIAAALRESQSARQAASTGTPASGDAPLMPVQVDDLVWLGIDPTLVRQLKPFVQLLPPKGGTGNAPPTVTNINANTAPAEVLQAALPGLTPAQAQQLVLARQNHPFQTAQDVLAALGLTSWPPAGLTPTPSTTQYAVDSSYFEIYGQLRYEQHLIRVRSVVDRLSGFNVQVLRRERIAPDAP